MSRIICSSSLDWSTNMQSVVQFYFAGKNPIQEELKPVRHIPLDVLPFIKLEAEAVVFYATTSDSTELLSLLQNIARPTVCYVINRVPYTQESLERLNPYFVDFIDEKEMLSEKEIRRIFNQVVEDLGQESGKIVCSLLVTTAIKSILCDF